MTRSGKPLRAASSAAQSKAWSLLGEPSTPTTTARRGVGLLLKGISWAFLFE